MPLVYLLPVFSELLQAPDSDPYQSAPMKADNPMPFPIYQYVINLVLRLPIRKGPDVFMNEITVTVPFIYSKITKIRWSRIRLSYGWRLK